jgi:hypothetical protein
MKKSFPVLVLVLVLAPFASLVHAESATPATTPAAPLVRSLGRNLVYLRVHTLPDDLPAAISSPQHPVSLVVDLRFVQAGDKAVRAFAAWLKFQARPATPVIVLINAQTSPALLAPLDDAVSPPGVVSIGPAAATIKPDIALALTAEADRLAYEALEHGTPVEELITPRLDKTRHDESTINKERVTGAADDEESDFIEAAPPPPAKAAEPVAPVPFDAVLQRALQLHRALLALRKIP